MASLEPSPSPFPLLALPPEIHLAILPHLPFLDLHTLRLTNHHFHALIPPPTYAEFLAIEKPGFDFVAYVGCSRLQQAASCGHI
jgi:hypothetical protein